MTDLMTSFEGVRRGDKLRVVNTRAEAVSRIFHDFMGPMCVFLGREVTVAGIASSTGLKIMEDDGEWWWHPSFFYDPCEYVDNASADAVATDADIEGLFS